MSLAGRCEIDDLKPRRSVLRHGAVMRCPRCARFIGACDLRCYDYRIGWLCIHCEGELRGKTL